MTSIEARSRIEAILNNPKRERMEEIEIDRERERGRESEIEIERKREREREEGKEIMNV